ncbi:MAG: ATP-grasp domain-containing protein [Flavobacteriales bacterium]|nr:ATP-grasp domain-containing protein [Flavobacteriales bacterium]
MDIAKRKDGGWTIMELGDGPVSGLPVALEPKDFYERLFALIKTVV